MTDSSRSAGGAYNSIQAFLARFARFGIRFLPISETRKASFRWGSQRKFHLVADKHPHAIGRSNWLADEIIGPLGITSVLEVGTNSGRNLQIIRSKHPNVLLSGIDINRRAIRYAKAKGLDIDFRVADANRWSERLDSWDALLTMSVLDHVPDEAIDRLADNMVATTRRYIIAFELWDGSHGTRGPYKYSRDTRALFEQRSMRTLRWEVSPAQYDTEKSLLWVYVGERVARSEEGLERPHLI